MLQSNQKYSGTRHEISSREVPCPEWLDGENDEGVNVGEGEKDEGANVDEGVV